MRPIKFRGKTKVGNEWIYGTTISQGTIKRKANMWYMEVAENKWKGLQTDSLGQFTGLEDENGKEIYEGDIVDWTFFYNRIGPSGGATETDIQLRGVIKWGKAGFIFEVWRNDFENAGWYGIADLNFDPASDIEVIGNIYDNPELVEE